MQKFYSRAFFVIALLSFGLCFETQAQTDTISRDYIINIKGDTIKGQVLRVGSGVVKIDPISETHTVKYSIKDVKEARQTGKLYFPVIPTGAHDAVFMERVVHGTIDVYEHVIGGYNGNYQYTWYAAKGGKPAKEIKTSSVGTVSRSERKQNLAALIGDNPTLAKEFDGEKDYSFDSLAKLIMQYNEQAANRTYK